MKQDNFANRYIIKLGSSVVIAILNMVIQVMLPRAISTDEFGYFGYNLNVFTSVVVLANLSTSNALVAKFSKKNDEIGLVRFYLKFYAIMALVLNAGIFALFPIPAIHDAFGGQTFLVVLLALDAYVMNKLLTDVVSMYDASAISRFPALMQVVIKIVLSLVIVIGFVTKLFNLAIFYVFMSVITLAVIIVLLVALFRDNHNRYGVTRDAGTKIYLKEYYEYCRPLVLANVFSQLVIILMNYTLLRFAGSTETAMFTAAWQLNTLVGYVFSPYAELMKREFAVIVDDETMLRNRLHQSVKMMFWVTSYFAIFIGFFAKWILPIVFGNQYEGAAAATLLVMFYTIYQAIGQVTGAFLLATERTRAQAIFTGVGQVLTLGFVFLLQVPNVLFPHGLGASGMAWNYLICNFIMDVVILTYIAHAMKMNKLRINLIQVLPIIICSGTAYLLYLLIGRIPGDGLVMAIIRTFIGGAIYSVVLGVVLYFHPDWIGMTKESLQAKLQAITGKLCKKKG
ncbi:Membrane protein involved in the export of O-antigen and teichoic acid [Lachnospiraceae bacterium XBD2001]|nr:Membrane protein involved in the export of O-antigen and teichoic acid [Lachnospiraceae bacterium XBD2001]